MSKFNLKAGDRIHARSSATVDENTYRKIGGHVPFEKPLTVSKAFPHGVRTKEMGYIHNNNILAKVDEE